MDVTEEYLDELVRDMVLCAGFIDDAQRKLENELQYRKVAEIRRQSSLESWVFGYRAPRIDKAMLEGHLAKLKGEAKEQAEPVSVKKRPRLD